MIENREGKFVTTVSVPMSVRQDIKNRGLTMEGCIIQGLKAIDEKLTWNSEKEERLRLLEDYRKEIVIEKAKARIKALTQDKYFEDLEARK